MSARVEGRLVEQIAWLPGSREEREVAADKYPQQPLPSDLLLPSRVHLPKVPKLVLSTGDLAFMRSHFHVSKITVKLGVIYGNCGPMGLESSCIREMKLCHVRL